MEEGQIGVLNKKVDDLTSGVNRLSYQFDAYLRSQGTNLKGKGALMGKDKYTQDFSEDENEERGNWSGRLDFLLACLGYAVGLGNVWRFPYLCYKNGGAVFFIPYVIMLVFVGMPIFFMELSLGQYTSQGPLTCWEMAPIFKGVGVGMVVVSGLVGIYYNMIIAWSFYYLFASFQRLLPWQECGQPWNTEYCIKPGQGLNLSSSAECTGYEGYNETTVPTPMGYYANASTGWCYESAAQTQGVGIFDKVVAKAVGISPMLPSEEYLKYSVWQQNKDGSSGIENLGEIHWELVLCLLLSWIVVCLALVKGVKSSGKVVYFTALFPYFVLVILFVRGFTLEGYEKGIEFYIMNIQWEKLSDAQVWKDAAVQIFFSLSASWGGLIALASYNRFHNDALRDTLIVSISNCLTSFFAGFVIFAFLGFLAQATDQDVSDVVDSGVGLAFIVYPAAVTLIPPAAISPLWAVLFFGMLITLGLDSEFALMETVTTAFMDQFPKLRKHKGLVILGFSAIFFLLGLTMCTSGGEAMLTVIDTYAGGWNVLVIAFLECICISYVYGVFRFKNDIRVMLGPTVCCCTPWSICFPWWMLCWSFFTPAGVLFVLVFSWVGYTPIGAGYPIWADGMGWAMTLTVIVSIVFTPIFYFIFGVQGSMGERFHYMTNPTPYWGPALVKHRADVKHLPDFVQDPHSEASLGATNAQNEFKVNEAGYNNQAYQQQSLAY